MNVVILFMYILSSFVIVLVSNDLHVLWAGVLLFCSTLGIFILDRYGWICYLREHRLRVYLLRLFLVTNSFLFLLTSCVSLIRFLLLPNSSFFSILILLFIALLHIQCLHNARFRPPPPTTNILNPLAKSPNKNMRSFSVNRPFGFINTTNLKLPQSRKMFFRVRDKCAPYIFSILYFCVFVIVIGLLFSSSIVLFFRSSCISGVLPYSSTITDDEGRRIGAALCTNKLETNAVLILPSIDSVAHSVMPLVNYIRKNSSEFNICVLDSYTDYMKSLVPLFNNEYFRQFDFSPIVSIGTSSIYTTFINSINQSVVVIDGKSPLATYSKTDFFSSDSLFVSSPQLFTLIHSLFPLIHQPQFSSYLDGIPREEEVRCLRSGFVDNFNLNHVLKNMAFGHDFSKIVRFLLKNNLANYDNFGELIVIGPGNEMKEYSKLVKNSVFVENLDFLYEVFNRLVPKSSNKD
ncbi:hypothetical protein GEMRC1_008069 [Eukaryota sp. GEM-RC1]